VPLLSITGLQHQHNAQVGPSPADAPLGHNGEINTLLGNINWMMAREADLSHPVGKPNRCPTADCTLIIVTQPRLTMCWSYWCVWTKPTGSLMIMVPEAYQNQPDLDNYPEIDFYEYYSGIQESGMDQRCWCLAMD